MSRRASAAFLAFNHRNRAAQEAAAAKTTASSSHSDFAFVEADCEIGGCQCPIWEDWWIKLREYAQQHERALPLQAIVDDEAFAEAMDRLAEDLESEFVFRAPACPRPNCLRSDAGSTPNDEAGFMPASQPSTPNDE